MILTVNKSESSSIISFNGFSDNTDQKLKLHVMPFGCKSGKFVGCNLSSPVCDEKSIHVVDPQWVIEYDLVRLDDGAYLIDWCDLFFNQKDGQYRAVLILNNDAVGQFQINLQSNCLIESPTRSTCENNYATSVSE